MKSFAGILALAVLLAAPRAAGASTINFDCGTCGSHNTSFDITYSLVNSLTNTYLLTITATYQPPGAGVPDFSFINDVSFKLNEVTYQNGTPTLQSGPAEDVWTLIEGGISSGGCNGEGNGFYCLKSTGSGAARGGAGSTDSWVVFLDLASALGPSQAMSFKVQFTDANGNKVGDLISEEAFATSSAALPLTETPEPATLILVGAGFLFAARRLRRRGGQTRV
jgi:hypothetical protein